MSLLLYTKIATKNLPLRDDFPRQYPWTQMVNRLAIDLVDPFHYTSVCESYWAIQARPRNTKTFAQMCYERAKEIARIAGSQKIFIMWSGGIDSSALLLAFRQIRKSYNLPDIHIVCSHESVTEFPELWNTIVRDYDYNGKIHSSFRHPEYYAKQGILVTGEHGDQIMGSDVIHFVEQVCGEEAIFQPWEDVIPKTYDYLFGEHIRKAMIERYEWLTKACIFPIRTAFDWCWWHNFTNKWQHVKYRLAALKGWTDPQNYRSVFHFYDTPEWQRWSLDHHDEKIQNTLRSYKWVAKQYIIDLTRCPEYINKPKIGSLSALWVTTTHYDGLDTDLNPVSLDYCIERIRR